MWDKIDTATLNRTYKPVTSKIERITTGTGDNYVRDIQYTYDDMDNVLSRIDTLKSFTYDEFDRLKTWNNNGNILTYNYDIFGNQLNNSYNKQMSYNNRNQIISNTKNNDKKYNYTYDANGNILSDDKKSYTDTSFNKVLSYTKL